MSRMEGGLPEFNQLKDFSSGPVAESTGSARNAILRSMAQAGMADGDPASQQILGDFEATRARDYDKRFLDLITLNESAKQSGARNLAGIGAARSPYAALSLWGNAING